VARYSVTSPSSTFAVWSSISMPRMSSMVWLASRTASSAASFHDSGDVPRTFDYFDGSHTDSRYGRARLKGWHRDKFAVAENRRVSASAYPPREYEHKHGDEQLAEQRLDAGQPRAKSPTGRTSPYPSVVNVTMLK